ncbi:MAG TPA: glycosyltransferase family 2 protein [Paracoccaceae bacterium]|nr:glycosyltransferase family 2 protein [Paracoccaceae bacterium]
MTQFSRRVLRRLRAVRDDMTVRLSMRRVHGPARVDLPDDGVGVVALMRDAAYFAEGFLTHHLRLGVAHVVVLDNGSSDRTAEIAAGFDRVTVLRCDLPARMHECRMRARAARAVFRGGWTLFADADEMFGFAGDDRQGISALAAYAGRHGYDCVMAQMLDLFGEDAEGPYPQAVAAMDRWTDAGLERLPYHTDQIDFGWFLQGNVAEYPGLRLHRGGVRRVMFGENPFLTKHALVRNAPGIDPIPHPHCARGVRVADVTAVVRHYKLAGDWQARDRASLAARLWDHAEDARRLDAAARPGFRLDVPGARPFTGALGLLEDGFLVASDRYRAEMLRPD